MRRYRDPFGRACTTVAQRGWDAYHQGQPMKPPYQGLRGFVKESTGKSWPQMAWEHGWLAGQDGRPRPVQDGDRGTPVAGTFTITVGHKVSAPIPYDAGQREVEAALEELK